MKATIPILAKGTFPHTVKGREVVQVVDEEALRAIEQQSIPPDGILVDFDHYSDLTPDEIAKLKEMGIKLPSEAAGWIRGITRVGDKLFASVDLTAAGEAAIEGKNYVFTSPVFAKEGHVALDRPRVRPTLIKKVALTNEPNIRAIGAIANRAEDEDDPSAPILFPIANRGDGAEPETQNPNKEKTMLNKQLAPLLGCEETDEAILAAAKKMVASLKEITSAHNAAKEAEEKAKAAQDEAEVKSRKAWADAEKANADAEAARAEAKAAVAAKEAAEAKAAEDLANRAAETEKAEAEKAELKTAKEAAESQIGDLKNRVAELEGQIAERDKSLFDAKVKAELDKYPDLKNRAEAEAVLRSDFAAGCKFLATLPAPAKAPDPARPFGANPEDLANRAGDGDETSGEAVGCDRIVKALKNK